MLLEKAVLIDPHPNALPHPEREDAISALMQLDEERLRAVMAWAVSDELVPGHEDMGHDFTALYKAMMQAASFSAQDCLEHILAISTCDDGDDELASLLYDDAVCNAIVQKLPPLPHDAFVLFRKFLYGFVAPDEEIEANEMAIASFWAFAVAKLFDWGHLNPFIKEVSEAALDESKCQLSAWDALITARQAYINHHA